MGSGMWERVGMRCPVWFSAGDQTEPQAETGKVCSACGSADIRIEIGVDSTGVVSPDGHSEYREWTAVRCLDCGVVEEI